MSSNEIQQIKEELDYIRKLLAKIHNHDIDKNQVCCRCGKPADYHTSQISSTWGKDYKFYCINYPDCPPKFIEHDVEHPTECDSELDLNDIFTSTN